MLAFFDVGQLLGIGLSAPLSLAIFAPSGQIGVVYKHFPTNKGKK